MTGEGLIDVYFPQNQADAVGVRTHLESQDVRCVVVPLGDTAYPGIVDRGLPWGVIRVDVDDVERARTLVEQWQSAEREDLDEAFRKSDAPQRSLAPAGPRWGLIVLMGVLMFVVAMVMFDWLGGGSLPPPR